MGLEEKEKEEEKGWLGEYGKKVENSK